MENYKVFIPTAGIGSRVNENAPHINKALISVGYKPVISHIIDKFPKNIEIVIALGYKKDFVRDFLELAYPERKITFVEISNYDKEGSGLGLTLLECKDHLQCPFIFSSNDTIVEEHIPEPSYNWMAYADAEDTTEYRSVRVKNNSVYEICSKGATGDALAYIGLAGIHNFQDFWSAMEEGKDKGSIAIGESYGLKFLIEHGISTSKFTWHDTGNPQALKVTKQHFDSKKDINVLEKETEAIWFVDQRVVKFSLDEKFIADRVKRTQFLKGAVPKVLDHRKNMYVYQKAEGEIFAKKPEKAYLTFFLNWMESFWAEKKLNEKESEHFQQTCYNFYKNKTYQRVEQYFKRFELFDSEEIINGEKVPKLQTILSMVDWELLSQGTAVRFHGDLHFENIIICENATSPFTLLDWRQNFGGITEYGDLYYDLAKLNHGFIIAHELINQNHFEVFNRINQVNFDFLRKQKLVTCQEALRNWVIEKGYNYYKVELLTSLIFLNIASLHHYPYSSLLFYLGKSELFSLINRKLESNKHISKTELTHANP